MTKLVLGNQDGDARSDLSLDTDGSSGLEIRGGDLHERATQSVRVVDRGNGSSSGRRSLAMGAFLLVALGTIAVILGATTRYVAPVWIPVVIVGSLVALYLVACVVLPKENASNLAAFGNTLKDFMGFVFGKPPRES